MQPPSCRLRNPLTPSNFHVEVNHCISKASGSDTFTPRRQASITLFKTGKQLLEPADALEQDEALLVLCHVNGAIHQFRAALVSVITLAAFEDEAGRTDR